MDIEDIVMLEQECCCSFIHPLITVLAIEFDEGCQFHAQLLVQHSHTHTCDRNTHTVSMHACMQ